MYKVTDKEVEEVIEQSAELIDAMITEYKYLHKLDVCVPTIEVYPIADQGYILLFYCEDNDHDAMGSLVVIDDEGIFTTYGNDKDLFN